MLPQDIPFSIGCWCWGLYVATAHKRQDIGRQHSTGPRPGSNSLSRSCHRLTCLTGDYQTASARPDCDWHRIYCLQTIHSLFTALSSKKKQKSFTFRVWFPSLIAPGWIPPLHQHLFSQSVQWHCSIILGDWQQTERTGPYMHRGKQF